MSENIIEAITLADLEEVVSFLQAENMTVSTEQLNYLIKKNQQLSQLVRADGRVVGVVLCSFDGIRAYLNKLVVNVDYRQQGWGQKLIVASVKKLRELECSELLIVCKPFLENWYAKQGFIKQESSCYILPLTEQKTQTLSCG